MKVLFCGDVCGKSGRNVLLEYLPKIKKEFAIDFTIVNGENSAHGFGINAKIADTFFHHGVDVITLGNHSFDKPEIKEYMKDHANIIRPLNYLETEDTNGFCFINYNKVKIVVINLLAKVFTYSKIKISDPFVTINNFLQQYRLTEDVDIIIIDFHGETTSEKMAMGFFLDGKVSAMLGTHTHVPTSDARILPNGTGYLTDAGMCGDFNSVIGMEKENVIKNFFDANNKKVFIPAEGKGTLCGAILDIDEKSGLCRNIESIIQGKAL